MDKSKPGQHGGARPGAGRPPAGEQKRKVRTFKASDEEWAEIRRKAKMAGLTISEYIRIRVLGG